MAEKMTYTIPLNPITKKNSQRIVTLRGRPIIMPSQAYKDYEREAEFFLRPKPETPIDYPVTVKCVYYVKDRRKRDLTNLLECTHDVLTKSLILSDDNYQVIVSVDGSRVYYDKENPRTEITIERYEE